MIDTTIRKILLKSRLNESNIFLRDELDITNFFDLELYKCEVVDLLLTNERYLLDKLNTDSLLLKSIEKDIENYLLGNYDCIYILNLKLLEKAVFEVGVYNSLSYK